jgi:hypothetical protein
MLKWKQQFNYDPIIPLLAINNQALGYHVHRDLLDKDVPSTEFLWNLQDAQKILKKQQTNGSWKYPSRKEDIRTQENYAQLETYRQLGMLVELYDFTNNHDSIKKAADFLFTFQTREGDFRGIYGTQYTPNYTAGILELLIKAGYNKDNRIKAGLEWLLSVRQNDGGWAVPIRTNKAKWNDVVNSKVVLEPNRPKSFSYMVTGVVLRAFAAHSEYRKKSEIKSAGQLLLSKFFKKDNYPDRGDKSYWTKFTFPFWFTDLLSALDSLFFLGFTTKYPQIEDGLEWFKLAQESDGTWNLKLLKGAQIKDYKTWIYYLICKTFKRYYHQ